MIYAAPTTPEPQRLYAWAQRLIDDLNRFSGAATATKGDKGDTGSPGPKGDTGVTGATGARGPMGLTGATGSAGSGGSYTVATKTAGYTETTTTGEILIKADLAAGFTILLPTAVGNTATITVAKMQTAGQITVDGAGTETIDGGLTAVLNNQYEAITLKSDGANWLIV